MDSRDTVKGVIQSNPAMGPLRVHPSNPRYFTDGSGKAIYLTGSHTWTNLQDAWTTDPPRTLDYTAYLDFMQQYNHNFMRMWRDEHPKYEYSSFPTFAYTTPHPWERTGPGNAGDGEPKFDLTEFNQGDFDRLRSRVIAARERGIYVSIMFFEGHAAQFATEAWFSHPFNINNNVNEIDGDSNGDGQGLEIYTLQVPEVTALQEAYVRKIVDTVNDLDNVLYEISNETGPYSRDWQYHMINYIKDYETNYKPNQHPVGMTFQYEGGSNETLFNSPADWISPRQADSEPYKNDPPAADGSKVIILDTDHLWGASGAQRTWVWKSFLRGHNPIYMDSYYDDSPFGPPADESIRENMGYTLNHAHKVNLAAMVPRGDLASTDYCLANPVADGAEYLVYLPHGGTVRVDLSGSPGELSVAWFNPSTGVTTFKGTTAGGAERSFTAPFSGDAVLYIWDGPIFQFYLPLIARS
ncbi:MAG: hypothetical protein IMY83_00190 [Chloroflexi bacterium]|nr:hypothetical protein [Chloroflexota bacterium]